MGRAEREDPRLTGFKQYVAAHRTIQRAHTELLDAIKHSSYNVVFVVGPTGAGKTTLLRKVERDLVIASSPNAAENRGYVPVLAVEAKAPVGASFSWSSFFADALAALSDPHIGKVATTTVRPESDGAKHVLRRVGSEGERYRSAYERALLNRRPAAVLIDEGHSLANATAPRLQATMELLKSLTTSTNVVHVLVGTYAMQPLMWHSGQLARRTKIIHFPAYTAEHREDLEEFASVLEFFERRLPLPARPKLTRLAESFFTQSAGLVGVLSTWLYEAVARALGEGASVLTEEHIRDTALAPGAVAAIRSEADEGRRFVESLTGRAWSVKATPTDRSSPTVRKQRVGPAGRRKPTRDTTGHDGAK